MREKETPRIGGEKSRCDPSQGNTYPQKGELWKKRGGPPPQSFSKAPAKEGELVQHYQKKRRAISTTGGSRNFSKKRGGEGAYIEEILPAQVLGKTNCVTKVIAQDGKEKVLPR